MSINYKGITVQILERIIEKNPGMSIGEVLLNVLHTKRLGKHYFYASDEEIYSSLEEFDKYGAEEDEPLSEEDFDSWVTIKTADGFGVGRFYPNK